MPRGDGVTQVFFRDPDGYVLELFQWTDEDQSGAPERSPVRGYALTPAPKPRLRPSARVVSTPGSLVVLPDEM